MFFFQIEKHKDLFQSVFWNKAPITFIIVAVCLITLFIIFGVTGDLFVWVENQRWLIYLFMTLFISVFYLIVISFVSKYNNLPPKSIIKVSFYGTFLFIVISIFLI